jgi:hypothetical protein
LLKSRSLRDDVDHLQQEDDVRHVEALPLDACISHEKMLRNRRIDMIRHTVLAGFALAAVVALGSFCSAIDQPLRPTQAASALGGFPAARYSRPLDQEAERIKRLTESLEQSRAAAEKNLLLLADVGYYEAELAASRRVQSVVAQ